MRMNIISPLWALARRDGTSNKEVFIMKKIKHLVSILAAAVLLLAMPGAGTLRVSADEPVTYIIRYDSDEQDWQYRIDNDAPETENYYRELYYLNQVIKNGDVIAFYYDGSAPSNPTLDLSSVRLGNLTIAQSDGFCIILTGGITDCYVLGNTTCSINGDVRNAYVYDTAVCNFGNNVTELRLTSEKDDIASTIGCSGTVGHFFASCATHTNYDLYSFQPNTFSLLNGILQTPADDYSQSASSQTPAEPAPAPTAAPQQPQTSQPSAGSSGEYDSVPKTGENGFGIVQLLLCISAVCMTGSLGIMAHAKARRK